MTNKYITIVIRADDETAARSHVPGTRIGPNEVVGVSLGNVLTVNHKLRDLLPDDRQTEADEIENISLAPFLPRWPQSQL